MAAKLTKSSIRPGPGEAAPITRDQRHIVADALKLAGHQDVWYGGRIGEEPYFISSTPPSAPADGSIRQYTYIARGERECPATTIT